MPRPREFDEDDALRKAMHTFWSRGFEGTSVADLIVAMGVSRSTLYASFGDKDAVFARALELYLRDVSAERVRILREATSVRDGLRAFFAHHIRVAADPKTPAGCFFVNTAIEGHISDRTSRIVDDAMSDLLERGVAAGELDRTTDARAAALMLVAVSYGIHVMARMQRDRKTLQMAADAAIASVR